VDFSTPGHAQACPIRWRAEDDRIEIPSPKEIFELPMRAKDDVIR
jgi:hypothetical protein